MAELITSLNIPQRLHWAERAIWTNWSCAWASIRERERLLTWSTKSDMWRDIQPAADTQRALTHHGGMASICASHQETHLAHAGQLFHWDLFSASKVHGTKSGVCQSTQAYHPCHSAFAFFPPLLCVARWQGGSHSVVWWRVRARGAHRAADCGPVAGDVLFDQLSRGFRQEEVNVHRLSGRTPLGEPIALCLPVYFLR